MNGRDGSSAPASGSLAGRVALVTGAASGLGLAIGRRMLAEGSSVLFTDVDEAALKATAPDDARAASLRADVSSAEDAQAAVSLALDRFGSLDILVNNAGIITWTAFDDLSLDQWERVMRINVTGMFLFARAFAKALRPRPVAEGATRSIVNIASVEGHVAVASDGHPQVHYNASKGAVVMLTKALAVELAPQRIRVNAIAPGVTETPITASNLANERKRGWYLERIPMGRFGRPDDIAAAAVFLASDQAAYITGVSLPVDGGFLAM
jgi:NAD(P)-dependent dehydrogenase (short-subunit alcohol dehydrogenase family)